MTNLVALVAEDEAVVRMVAADALTDAGFRVIEAADAESALRILTSEADSIDAVFTDLNMPGRVDGRDLAHEVRHRWPWIKLLMTTGHTSAEAKRGKNFGFLPKPYDVSTMPARVRDMILNG